MNARKHRQLEQAKETDRLGPKGNAVRRGGFAVPRARTRRLPVYRANLNHPVHLAEHGNAARPARPRDRADLTARRVRGHSLGMTEEANASGNALDMPTSVGSEMVGQPVEPPSIQDSK